MKLATTFIVLLTFMTIVSQACAVEPTLKQAFADDFLVGAALSEDQLLGKAPEALALTAQQFNSITPENVLKWEKVHPESGRYDFDAADQFVEFGEKHGMFIVGHTLVWHNQTPEWVFEDDQGNPLGRDDLLERMREHIHTVVGRYKGRIKGWDVVNEAIDVDAHDDRNASWRKTKWREIIGPDYIEKAFQFAHEADPNAELYYNDYDEWKSGKLDYFQKIVNDLRSNGLRIDGLGLQGHWGFDYPQLSEVDAMFQSLGKLGVKLMITELDINVLPAVSADTGADVNIRLEDRPEFNPYPESLPDAVQQQLTERYASLFEIFRKYRDNLDRVTFWGVDDGQSWRNYWPIRGRTNYPLLFDRKYQPKPAFDAVIRVASEDQKD